MNFEADSTHVITVRVSDGSLWHDEALTISLQNVNEAPIAISNTATAIEAGGTSNGTAGTNPTSNVLTNDTDVDAADTKTVVGVSAGVQASAAGSVASAVNGSFGSINIAADGSYTYTVDNNNAAVQALRTSANTLQDVFTYTMRDTAGLTSTTQITVTIQGANDAPTQSSIESPALAYSENAGAVVITSTLTLADVDDANLSSATVQITGNYVAGQDLLSFTDQNGITGSWNSTTGTLTLSGSATTANYQAALRSITYANSSEAPSTSTRTVSFTVSDGSLSSSVATRNIAITAVNDAPVNLLPGVQTTGVNASVTLSGANALQISDVDAASSAVRITLTAANGTMTLGSTAGLSFTTGDGTADASMVIQGTVAAINAALDGLSFTPTNNFNGTATITLQTEDLGNTGTGGNLTDTDVLSIQVGGVRFQEGVNGYTGTQDTYVNSSSSNSTFGNSTTVMVDDPSSHGLIRFDNLFGNGAGQIATGSTITNATLSIYVTATDNLDFINVHRMLSTWSEGSTWNSLSSGVQTNNVEASTTILTSFSAGQAGWVTITGITSTVQAWANGAANQGFVLFGDNADNWAFYSSEFTTASLRPYLSITFQSPQSADIDLDSNNSSGATGSSFERTWTENGGAVTIADIDATITDADSSTLQSMTVTISNRLDGVLETLSANTAGTSITASYDSGTGQLTLSGNDTVANYQSVLRTIAYNNTSESPNTTSRLITIQAADAFVSSNIATATVAVVAVNDAPVLDNTGNMTLTSINEDQTTNAGQSVASIITSAGGDRLTDPDSASAPEGIAINSLTSGNGTWQYSTNAGSSWTDIGTVSDSSALLLRSTDLVRFVPNAENATTANFTFRAWDQTSGSTGSKVDASTNGGTSAFSTAIEVASITVTAVNDAPVLDAARSPVLVSVSEHAGPPSGTVGTLVSSLVDFALPSGQVDNVTDVDAGATTGIAITATNAVNGTWWYSTDNGSNWQRIGNVTNTAARLLMADASTRIYFEPTQSTEFSGTISNAITFRAWDGSSGSNGGTADTSTNGDTTAFSTNTDTAAITVNNVNDAPRILGSELITNGDFTTNLSGWTTSGSVAAVGGRANLGLSNLVGPHSISQTIATVAGQTYQLSFDYFDGSSTRNQSLVATVNGISNLLTTQQIVTDIATTVPGARYTFTFVADSSSTTFTFTDTSDQSGLSDGTTDVDGLIDNVSVRQLAGQMGTLSYTENAGPIAIHSTVNLSDFDSTHLVGATVQFASGFSASQDILAFTNQLGITGSYNSSTGVLTLTGTATIADYQTALRSITYTNSSESPTSSRTISFTVDDGTLTSTVATRSIAITAVNDNPVAVSDTATAVEAGGVANGTAGTNPTGNVLTNDTDVDAGDTKTVTGVSAGVQASAAGPVASPVTGNFGSITIAADGTYTYNVDNNNAAVQALRTSSNTLQDVFTYTMRDTAGLTSTTQITITIQGANDAPTNISEAQLITITNPSFEANALTNGSFITSASGWTTSGGGSAGTFNPSTSNFTSGDGTDGANVGYTNNGSLTQVLSTNFDSSRSYSLLVDVGRRIEMPAVNYTVQLLAGGTVIATRTGTTGAAGAWTTVALDVSGASFNALNGQPLSIVLSSDASQASWDNVRLRATGGSSFTIAENSSNGSVVGQAIGSDSDVSDAMTFTLVNDAGGRFAINSTTGVVTVANGSLLDFESNTSHNLVVRATDLGGLSFEKTMTVSVSNVNEAPLNITNLNHNGLSVGDALVSANGQYRLSVQPSGDLTLKDLSGQVVWNTGTSGSGLFLAIQNDGNVVLYNGGTPVWASNTNGAPSTGTPILGVTNDGRVTIQDEQTGNILWDSSIGTLGTLSSANFATAAAGTRVYVHENAAPGTLVASFKAYDVDHSSGFTYTLVGGRTDLFEIASGSNLTVKSGAAINFESNSSFTVDVQVTDAGGLTYVETVSIQVIDRNETPTAASDSAIAVEAGGISNGVAGTNPTGNVLTNDTDVDAAESRTVIGVSAGVQASAAGSVAASVTGTYGNIIINADGTYTYTVDNNNVTVQALRTTSDTLSDVFTYTMRDAGGLTSTTQITFTIQGANDAPVGTSETINALEAGGVNNGTAGTSPTGNVLANDTDPDSSANGETLAVTGVAAGNVASASGSVASNVSGLYGSITIAANGVYSFTVNNSDPTVQALANLGQSIQDIFTYTITDAAGLTSSTQLTVIISGANDAPTITSNGGGATAAISMAENVTAVTTVVGNDVDAGTTLTYSIFGGADAGRFSIDSVTGSLVFVTAPDFEAPTDAGLNNVYDVIVQVSDGSLATLQTLAVTITDVSNFLVVTTATDNNDSGITTGAAFNIEWLNANKGADASVSLREAIIAANNTAGTDTVSFNIAGSGVQTINLTSALPAITNAIVINGYTQSGSSANTLASGNDAVLNVVLNGSGAGANAHGLRLLSGSSGSTIQGLSIQNFTGYGIYGQFSSSHIIAGNWIGLNSAGTGAAGNGQGGVFLEFSDSNQIGGLAAADRNVISGNTGNGVTITGINSVIRNNYIGTNAAGTSDVGNTGNGILLSSFGTHTIGGTVSSARNIISGNDGSGIRANSSSFNTIQGNWIGLDVTGTSAIGNGTSGQDTAGIYISGGTAQNIGGTAAGAGNVISGNFGTKGGVVISGTTQFSTMDPSLQVYGNFIGTNALGTAAVGNQAAGIYVENSTSVGIGGTTAAHRNIISGNRDGVVFTGASTTGNRVQGNYIGTNQAGTAALGNSRYGVWIDYSATGNTIGGAVVGAGNVISGNTSYGVYLTAGSNTVAGNVIGLNAAGTAAIANSHGVFISNVSNNTIGGTTAAARNVISGNISDGIAITGSSAAGNLIQGNYIGTNLSGSSAIANGSMGVRITGGAAGNTVGGSVAGAGNVISGNANSGVYVDASNTTVQGNLIGTNAAGTAAIGNGSLGSATGGVFIASGTGSVIGGTTAAERNVLSGNGGAGIWIEGTTGSHTIQGNYIGVDVTGDVALGNNRWGVVLNAGTITNIQIGGTAAGAGNVISGSTGGAGGIFIANASGTVIEGNRIGIGANNTNALGTVQAIGISVNQNATNTRIGGSTAAAGNIIARNGSIGGVAVWSNASGTNIQRNQIFGNGGLGIDLGANGATANDGALTAGQGNQLMDSPVISNANLVGNDLTLSGFVGSAAGQSLFANSRVEFYKITANASVYLGALNTDANGNYSGTLDVTGLGLNQSDSITATATDSNGNTSEFSTTFQANAAPTAVSDSATATEAGGVENGTSGINPTGNVLTNDTDPNSGDTKTVIGVSAGVQPSGVSAASTPVTGTYGSITIAADGSYTYSVNNNHAAVQALASSSDTLQDVFTYTMRDAGGLVSTTQITITIEGRNDNPFITIESGDSAAESINETNGTLTTSGTLTVTDVDTTNTVNAVVSSVVASGTTSGLQSNNAALLAMFSSISNVLDNTEVTDKLTWAFNSGSEHFNYLAAGESLVLTYTITVTDSQSTTDTQTVVVTINGTNDTPTITVVDVNGAVTEDASTPTLTDSGSVTFTEVDETDMISSSVALSSTSTTGPTIPAGLATALSSALSLAQTGTNDGTIVWNFNLANNVTQYLAAGETVTAVYTITVTDDSGTANNTATRDVTVVITGTNDVPTITVVDVNGSVTEDASTPTLTDSGSVTFAEVDDTDVITSSVALTTTSTTGPAIPVGLATALSSALSLNQSGTNDGTIVWNFNLSNNLTQYLAAGETVTAVYTITVTDDSGTANNTATRDVTVVITGTNDAPTITVVDVNGAVTEDTSTPNLTDSGSVTFAEVDDTDVITSSVALTTTSTTGPAIPAGLATALSSALSLNQSGTNDGTIVWNFNLSNNLTQYLAAGETITAVYTITVTDDSGTANNTATRDVTVIITGTNDVPTITVVDVNGAVTEDASTSALTDSGSVTFAEVDDTDLITSSVALTTTSTTGPAIPAGLATALSSALSLNQSGTNDGTIAWNFNLANNLTQYLAAGETVTAVYTITVADDSGTANNTATRDVTVVITGTNDAPTITVVDVNGAVTEDASTPSLTDSGSVTFAEVDDTDLITSSVALTTTSTTGPAIPAGLATALSSALSLNQTGTNDGTIVWNFNLANNLTEYLAVGETVTAVYTITVTDDSGNVNNTATRDVTVVITGTNDVPTITVVDVNGAVTEDASTPTLTDSGSVMFAEVDDTDVITSSVALTTTSTTGPAIPAGLATALSSALSLNQSGTNDGTIVWNFNLANNHTQYLAAGETVTAVYTITVTDDSGTANNTATRDVTVVITGTNDAPTITVVDVTGAVTEDASTPTLTDSGSVTFAEVDDTDVITSSVALTTTSTTGPAIPAGLATALSSALSLNQTGTNDGTIVWNFNLSNNLTQYLAAGETVTAVYTITVADDSGTANNTATRDVTITITGTNDVPTITVVDVNGAVTEDASTPTLTDSGSLTFAEVDDTDVITSAAALTTTSTTGPAIPAGLATALSSALSLNQIGTNDGTIAWNFNLANNLTQYLAAGETVTAVYTITVTDDSGTANNTATRDVTVVITGTNDDPIITIGGGDSAAETLSVTGSTLTTAGSLSVADIDRTDVVTAAVANFAKSGDLTGLTLSDAQLQSMLSLNANVISNTQQNGTINWGFNSAGYTFGYLAAGQSITLTYTINVTDSQGTVDAQDVVVTITGSNSAPNITIEAGDSSSSSLTETNSTLSSTGTLSVLDINTTDTVTAQVSSVTATGATTGLISNNAALLNMLSVNANVINNTSETGTITWNFNSASEAFDYLAAGETLTLTYTITATDSQNASDTQQVTITITGTNDEQVIVTNARLTVAENATGTVITGTMLQTTDLDQSSAHLTYTLTAYTTTGTLRRAGVALTTNDTFTQADLNAGLITYDHDGSETFADAFSFSVDDGEGASSSGTFNIAITPVNDQTPIITSNGGAATVSINIDENTTAVTTVAASDADLPSHTITYHIVGGADAGLFQVDANTGELSFISGRDRENATDADADHVYEVEVQATDGTLFDTQLIRVNLQDINETAVSTPVDLNSDTNAIDENVPVGTIVGITANAFDLDATNSTITYTLSSNPDGLFQIDPTTGIVTTATAINREVHGNVRTITIQAQSADGSTSIQSFTIAINDLNEFAVSPITDTNAAANFVVEGAAIGTTVGITASAVDLDATNDSVTYSLTDDAGGRFSIGAADGIVRVAGVIDREQSTTHQITVEVQSLDGSSSTVTYTITIGDINDNAPIVAGGQQFTIAENSLVGTSLGMVSGSDADITSSLQAWQIVADSSLGGFSIDANTGELTATRSFNFEAQASYTLEIRVSDGTHWSANQLVTIQVLNVNEAPVAIGESYSIRTDQIVNVSAPGLLSNDFDIDGDTLFPIIMSGPANGTIVVGSNGQLIYQPRAAFFGTDSFQYVVSDGSLNSNVVTVSIDVIAVNPGNGGNNNDSGNSGGSGNPPDGNSGGQNQNPPPGDPDANLIGLVGDTTTQDAGDTQIVLTTEGDRQEPGQATTGLSTKNDSPEISTNSNPDSVAWTAGAQRLMEFNQSMLSNRSEMLRLNRDMIAGQSQSIFTDRWNNLRSDEVSDASFDDIFVGSAGVTAGLFSVGYVMFALRGGVLIASAYSSIPAWRMLDPASLLTQSRVTGSRGDNESLQDLINH